MLLPHNDLIEPEEDFLDVCDYLAGNKPEDWLESAAHFFHGDATSEGMVEVIDNMDLGVPMLHSSCE